MNTRKEKAGATRLMAAIAVLAVAFVILAAVPAVADDSDAAGATHYVDAAAKEQGQTFNTLTAALDAANDGDTIVLKSDLDASKETLEKIEYTGGSTITIEKGLKITNAITIKSESADSKKTVPFALGVKDADNKNLGTLTLENIVVKPGNNDFALVAHSNGGCAKLVIKGCEFAIKPFATGDEKVAAINAYMSGDVTIEDTTFTVNGDHGNDYTVAAMIWNNTVSTKNCTVDGYSKFLNIDAVKSLTVENTTAKNMLGPVTTSDGELKNGTFIQLANTGGNTQLGKIEISGTTLENPADDFQGVATYPIGTGSTPTKLTDFTTDTDVVFKGLVTVEKATIGGDISLIKENGKDAHVTIENNGVLTVAKDKTLTADATATVVNNGSLVNNGTITMSTAEGSIAYSGNGTFYAGAGSSAKMSVADASKNNFVGSGTVEGITVSEEAKDISDLNALLRALESGASSVTLSADIDATDYTGGITVKAGTTLNGAGKVLKLGDKSSIRVDGAITNIKLNYDTTECITVGDGKQLSGSFYVKLSSTTGATVVAEKIQGSFTDSSALALSGKITGDLAIAGTGAIAFGNTTVNSGVKLTLPGDVSVSVNSTFNLYGALVNPGTTEITITVPEKAAFKAFSGAQIPGTVKIDGTGSIDLSKAQSPQTVGEDISYDKTYGQLEDVTIVGSLTIKNNSTVIVMGGFNVNENVTLTIEKGSKLIINSVAASMVVDGRIIVEEGATLHVIAADDVVVSGSVASEGTVKIASKVTVKSGGSILIDEGENSEVTVSEGLTIESGATLTVRAAVNGVTTIDNKGAVVLDGAVLSQPLNVNLLADSAVLDVKSVSGNNAITVTDEGLKFTKNDEVAEADANKIKFTPGTGATVKGLVLTEKVSSYVLDGTPCYTNTVVLSGSVSSMKESNAEPLNIIATGKNLAVDGTLDLGKNVTLTVAADSVLAVSGTVTATADSSSKIVSSGMIKVSGLIQTKNKIENGISAAMYKTGTSSNEVYNYTTLKAAVDASAKDIAVLGEIAVGESLTIPAGVTVKSDADAKIVVGSDDDNSVVLTVDASAIMKDGKIDVKGTLVFDDKKSDKTSDILSDVSVIGEKAAKYTNLVTALNGAQSGDVVTIDRDEVQLKSSVVVKEGVTLDVPNSKKIVLGAGVTLTVDGTLRTAEKVGTAENVSFSDVATAIGDEKTAAIVVNGVFMSMSDLTYEIYKIPGAYYSLVDDAGSYNYVTTVEKASKTSAGAIGIYGKVSAGDVAFAGTDSSNVAVAVHGELVASSIALDKATFSVDAAAKFTGTVKVADAAVAVKLVKDFAVSIDDGVLRVENASAADAKSSSFKVSAGSVEIHSASMNVAVAEGAKLVSCDAQSNIAGKLTIDGSVEVANGQTIVVDGDVVVNGLLSVATPTDTEAASGVFSAERIFVGVAAEKTTGAEASVSGPVHVSGYVVAVVGTLSDATVESLKFNGELVATTYVVEDADWIVVYDRTGDMQIGAIKKAPVENAKFNEIWNDSKGKNVNDKLVGDVDKVYADVKYDIYTIQVVGCKGVENIAVDGILLNGSTAVKTGAHEITCTVSGGYGGDVKLTLVSVDNDKTVATVSGKSVTVSGEAGIVVLQITGVTAVTPDTPEPTPIIIKDEDDGMSLTDILLIVLVVLIVIMAAIVALRMMRS